MPARDAHAYAISSSVDSEVSTVNIRIAIGHAAALARGARTRLLWLGLLAISLVPVVPLVAQAATIIVNTTVDSLAPPAGACSLRAAIVAANTNTAVGGCPAGSATVTDTIVLPCGTYTLGIAGADEDANASGDLDIAGDLILTGAGARTTIIDGGGIDRVFEIRTGTVTISDVTIRGGALISAAASLSRPRAR
jgi:CSLREA domain-containing protein